MGRYKRDILSDSISPQPSATIQKTQTPSPSLIITPDSSQLPESPDSSTLSKNTASFDIVLTLEIAAIALVTAIAITLAIVYKKRSK